MMKSLIVCSIIAAAGQEWVQAETVLEKQFAELTRDRDKAISEAIAPIEREFKAAGEALLKKAVKAGDVDLEAKLRAALKIQVAPDTSKTSTEAILKSGTWEWRPGSPEAEVFGTLTFLPDGKLVPSGSVGWLKSWEMVNNHTFRIYNTSSGYWLFEYFPERAQATTIEDPNSVGDQKCLTPLTK